jgi:hypothetical protein
MMRSPGGPRALAQGAASTTQMTDAILAQMERMSETAGAAD